jgi:hypothetical protein
MQTFFIHYKFLEVLVFSRYLNTKNFTPSFNIYLSDNFILDILHSEPAFQNS